MNNIDTIFINELRFDSLIGVYDFEREQPTELVADIVIWQDLSCAAQSDSLIDTVDYGAVAKAIKEVGKQSQFLLLEALASAVLTDLFAKFTFAKIELTLSKPNILPNCGKVGIKMIRERS